MIKKLNESYRTKVMEYLNQEKEINLFIIGDIERFGFDKSFQEVWGDLGEDDVINGILLKFYDGYIYYAKENKDVSGFVEIFKNDKSKKTLAGKKECMEMFEGIIEYTSSKESYFTFLKEFNNFKESQEIAKKASVEDVDKIIDLYNDIDEFKDVSRNIEAIKNIIESKSGRYYVIEKNNEFLSMAGTLIESKDLAMVGGVCTKVKHRKKGLGTKCVLKLCYELLKEGKTPCLFYSNHKAGNIYTSIGFREIGIWTAL